MSRVVVVPGLGVRRYAEPAVDALRAAGGRADLLRAPSWRGAPWDPRRFGERLAHDLDRRAEPVDLLVGLSVGTEAAAVAASRTTLVRRLLLVSPMVDPERRTHRRLLADWLVGPPLKGDPSTREQLPDWARAGLTRLLLGFHASLRVRLEALLPELGIPVTVVHTEWDVLGTWSWAQTLAEGCGGDALRLPQQAHSWPVHDPQGFVQLVHELVGRSAP